MTPQPTRPDLMPSERTCRKGHALTGSNQGSGGRCNACRRDYYASNYANPLDRTLDARFWARFAAVGECWVWQGSTSQGYGKVWYVDRQVRTHRLAYELLRGPIPVGLELDHLCRNRACGNPDHLEPVTARVNTLRSENPCAKRARQTHCKRGHEFTPENTYRPAAQPNARYCRECLRKANRERMAQRRKAERNAQRASEDEE